jgi:hypothetical protein
MDRAMSLAINHLFNSIFFSLMILNLLIVDFLLER